MKGSVNEVETRADASRALSQNRTADGVKLGVVCPVANERETAVRFVEEVLAACAPFEFESVTFYAVLDRVSRDGTLELLRELEGRRGDFRVLWAPENRSVEGYDCVFGSRFCPGGRISESSFKRRIISRGGTLLANLLLGTRLKDMTSGFELFSRGALQHVLERGVHSRGHFFQTEIKAHCHAFRLAEVPIHYRAASASVNNNVLKDAFKNLWRLFRARLSGELGSREPAAERRFS
jgi:dolichol-phosphate mannosyltransferase